MVFASVELTLSDNIKTESSNSTSSKNRKKVAIVVINYNGKEHLQVCFESLKHLSYSHDEFDVYMIDNNSVDGSVDFMRTYFPWVKVFAFDENHGFTKAYNMAVEAVDSEYVALLNNDVRVSENWLSPLVRALDADAKRFAAGSKLLFYDSPERINHAGAIIGFNGAGMDFGFKEIDSPIYNVEKETFVTCGGGMLVRRSIWKKLGGFDESFFAYYEDADICWRAWLSGYTCLYVPESIVYHKFGATFMPEKKETIRLKRYLTEKNSLLSILKNFQLSTLFWALPLTMAFNVIKIIVQFIRLKPVLGCIVAKSIFRAYKYVFLNITEIIKKREEVQLHRQIPDKVLMRKGFIYMPLQFLKRWRRQKQLMH